nr:glycosyltransferase, exosortase A system-associated [Desulfobacula sp.]
MKILHLLNHSFPLLDGYASRSQNIFKAQKKLGFSPVILTSPKHEEDWKKKCPKKERIDGFDFYRTGENHYKTIPVLGELIQILLVLLRLAQVIKIEKPDVLHAHSPVLNGIPAWIAGRWFRLPVVYEIRAFWEDAGVDQATYKKKSLKYELVKAVETWLCKHVDQVPVLCNGIRKDLAERGINPEKMTPVFNGIHPENFTPCLPDEDFIRKWDLSGKMVIGFIGSFYRYEGLDLLIDAYSKIASTHPNLVLLLVGGGEMDARLRQLVEKFNLADRVLMPGRIPHNRIKGVYALIDILIYPRYSVRLTELVTPLKPLEAMAMGKAVIASDIGGHRELITDKQTGILFKAGDATALSSAILSLLENPGVTKKLGIHGLQYVMEEKTWLKTTSVYKTIYARLPGGKKNHAFSD